MVLGNIEDKTKEEQLELAGENEHDINIEVE